MRINIPTCALAAALLLMAGLVVLPWEFARPPRTVSTFIESDRYTKEGLSEPAEPPGVTAEEEERATELEIGDSALPSDGMKQESRPVQIAVRSGLGFIPKVVRYNMQSVWRTASTELESGLFTVPIPCRIRSPGHYEKHIDSLVDRIVLEPRSSLTLECQCDVPPFVSVAAPGLQATWASVGALDGGKGWAIAADPDSLWRAATASEVFLELRCGAGRQFAVTYRPVEGQNHSSQLMCGGPQDAAPITMAVIGSDRKLVMSLYGYAEPSDELSDYIWGHVQQPRVGLLEQVPISIEAETYTTPVEYPMQRDYIVTLRDTSDGSFGRAKFTHSGSIVKITLQKGCRIRGRCMAASATAYSPNRLDIEWVLLDPTSKEPSNQDLSWSGSSRDYETGPKGEFEIVLPEALPLNVTTAPSMPGLIELWLYSPGFEPARVAEIIDGRDMIDLGTIPMEPSEPGCVLQATVAWSDLRFGSVKSSDGVIPIWNSRALDDDSIALYFAKKGSSVFGASFGLDVPFSESIDAEEILVRGGRDDLGLALKRIGRRHYRAVPSREYSIIVESKVDWTSLKPVVIGWEWRGLRHRAAVLYMENRESKELSVSGPESDCFLWWGTQNEELGRLDLNGVQGAVVVVNE